MTAPDERAVRLHAVQWSGPAPVEGDWLRTSTGRTYLIMDVRPGRSVGRYNLQCITGGTLDPTHGDHVIEWEWQRRPARSR